MAGLTDAYENQLREHLVGKAAWTMPSAIYLALFTTAPDDAGTGGVEVTGGAYARKLTVGTDWAAGGGSNATELIFPTATADWGTVVAVGLYDAATAGNLLAFGAVSPSVAVLTNQSARFNIAALTLTAD